MALARVQLTSAALGDPRPLLVVPVGQPQARDGSLLVVRDRFQRGDSTTTLGSAETGQAWTAWGSTTGSSVWGISGNSAYCQTETGGNTEFGTQLPIQVTAGAVEATLWFTAGSATNTGLLVRWQDSSNFLGVRVAQVSNQVQIVKQVAAARSFPGTAALVLTQNTAYRLRVEFSTATALLRVFVNGALLLSYTDSAFQSFPRPGLLTGSGTGATRVWRDFQVLV